MTKEMPGAEDRLEQFATYAEIAMVMTGIIGLLEEVDGYLDEEDQEEFERVKDTIEGWSDIYAGKFRKNVREVIAKSCLYD